MNEIPKVWHDSIIKQLESKPHFASMRKFVPLFKKGLLKTICFKLRIGKYVEEEVEFTIENKKVQFKKMDA